MAATQGGFLVRTSFRSIVETLDRIEHFLGRHETLVNPLEREAAKQHTRVPRKAAKQD
jgi:hypothetical protein